MSEIYAFTLRLFLHFHHFQLEYQRRVWRNLTCLALAVAQMLRYVYLPLCAFRHQMERFCPSLDDLRRTEGCGLWIALVAAVEHCAVDETTLVFHCDILISCCNWAVAFSYYLIFQSRRQGYYTWLLGILCQPSLSVSTQRLCLTLLDSGKYALVIFAGVSHGEEGSVL